MGGEEGWRESGGKDWKMKEMSFMLYVIIALASFLLLFSYFISSKSVHNFPLPLGFASNDSERKSQYECGFAPFSPNLGIVSREKFSLNFFIIALIFLIFDIETLLAYPVALLFFTFLSNDLSSSSPLLSSFSDPLFFSPFTLTYLVFFLFTLFLFVSLIFEFNRTSI